MRALLIWKNFLTVSDCDINVNKVTNVLFIYKICFKKLITLCAQKSTVFTLFQSTLANLEPHGEHFEYLSSPAMLGVLCCVASGEKVPPVPHCLIFMVPSFLVILSQPILPSNCCSPPTSSVPTNHDQPPQPYNHYTLALETPGGLATSNILNQTNILGTFAIINLGEFTLIDIVREGNNFLLYKGERGCQLSSVLSFGSK